MSRRFRGLYRKSRVGWDGRVDAVIADAPTRRYITCLMNDVMQLVFYDATRRTQQTNQAQTL